MDEKPYQNIDLPQNNPLDIQEDTQKDSANKPLNPKIILLIILVSLIFVLLLISLVVTQIRHKKLSTTTATPSPQPTTTQPIINDSLIPSPYQDSFKQLENSFTDPDLPVPQIDTEIGL